MDWFNLKDKVYGWDGSWRDVYVLQASRHDWKTWVEYVNQNCRINWFNDRTGRYEDKVDFGLVEDFWSGKQAACSAASVFIGNIQINAHFFVETEIENDVDPREFNSIEDHNKLVKYMCDLSVLLDKEIILTPENDHKTILFRVRRDYVEFAENIASTSAKQVDSMSERIRAAENQ